MGDVLGWNGVESLLRIIGKHGRGRRLPEVTRILAF